MSPLIIPYVWYWHLTYKGECLFPQEMLNYLAIYKLLSKDSSVCFCVCIYGCMGVCTKKKVKTYVPKCYKSVNVGKRYIWVSRCLSVCLFVCFPKNKGLEENVCGIQPPLKPS